MNRILLFTAILLSVTAIHGDSKIFIPRMQREKKVARVADAPTPPVPPQPGPQPAPVTEDPQLDSPSEVIGKVGGWIHVKAATNCPVVQWFTPDDNLSIFPQEQLRDATSTIVSSMTPGQYKLFSYTGNSAGITRPALTIITVQGAQPPPNPQPQPVPVPVPPPQPVPPPAPNPTAVSLWVVVVDNVSARDPRTTAILNDMAFWNGLTAQGHKWLKLNTTEAAAKNYKLQIDANGGVPCVIIMDANKTDHNWLNQNPADLKLPTTTAGLQALVNKYTTRPVQVSSEKYAVR